MLSWTSPGVDSALFVVWVLAGTWLVIAYFRAPRHLRRLWSNGRDQANNPITWRGLIVFGLALMFMSYRFVMQAYGGEYSAGDYRESQWWIVANQAIVLAVGPALILGGVLLWLWRRHLR